MKNLTFGFYRFPAIYLFGILLIFVAVFLGMRFSTNNVSSQEVKQTTMEPEKSLQEDEKLLVEVLRNKQLQTTSPEKVLEAIKELGKLARLRRISSTETIEVLTEYLDLPKDSMINKSGDPAKQAGILFETHPIGPDQIYPAVEALLYIGGAALPALLKVIENTATGSIRSDNALSVLKYNFREDFNKTADYLRVSAELAKSEVGRQRLLIAADKITRKEPLRNP